MKRKTPQEKITYEHVGRDGLVLAVLPYWQTAGNQLLALIEAVPGSRIDIVRGEWFRTTMDVRGWLGIGGDAR